MYETFYGFKEKPFSLTPDPAFLYMSQQHETALTMLEYGLTLEGGITVITGDIGSGKSTLIRRAMQLMDPQFTVGVITNTHSNIGELLKWVLFAFELEYSGKDKAELYHTFINFALSQYQAGRRTLLIIDEAQNMGIEALEELRMLTNVNTDKDQILQLLLVGQPELAEKLRRPEMRQFAQRITSDYQLHGLDFRDTRSYIRHRLQVAGGEPAIFDDMACGAVYFQTKGVPRLINTLCDAALVYGFAEDRKKIDMDTIFNVVGDKQRGLLNPFTQGASTAS
jgi:type II secretory pathway predicted ATPase ExeA